MLGTFTYHNPTKIYFGPTALEGLVDELTKYGPNVVLVYGGGSIKKNGVYDQVTAVLNASGKNVTEIAGVMPNPTVEKLREGVAVAKAASADLILAVGGGSVCDYSKAVSVSVNCDEDPWEKYFIRFEEPSCSVVPVGCVLTMAGTGSEMNAGAVITDHAAKLKVGHVFANSDVMPKFSILNPEFTLSLPHRQVAAGIYDAFNHICEQYFSGSDNNVSDSIAEGLMRSVVENGRIAANDDQNYEARSNIMWAATWALNTLIAKGKPTDWMVHMLGQGVGAVTDATHGMTLSAVSLPYYRFIMDAGLPKFARFATHVWGINPTGKSERELAEAGLSAMEAWMRELGVAMNLAELGVTEADLDDIAAATFIMTGGYKTLTKEDVRNVLLQCL